MFSNSIFLRTAITRPGAPAPLPEHLHASATSTASPSCFYRLVLAISYIEHRSRRSTNRQRFGPASSHRTVIVDKILPEALLQQYSATLELAENVSWIAGLCSVGIWIVALLPQVILNLRRRSASGLAFGLLCLWLVGDAAGVLGAFLTSQLVIQRLVASWHLFVDTILVFEWFWFHKQDEARILVEDRREADLVRQEQRVQHRKLSIEQAYHSRDEWLTPMSITRDRPSFSGPRGVLLPPRLARTKSERRPEVRRGRRTFAYVAAALLVAGFVTGIAVVAAKTHLFDHVLPHGKAGRRAAQRFGIFSAYFCAALYLGSRGPQIMHNWRRKSVQGLSISLFVLGLAANFFYVLSVLVTPRARNEYGWDAKYLWRAAPYLLTAIGASILDCFICYQWSLYRNNFDPDPRDRLEPGLARREALEAAGVVFSETPDHSRTPSFAGTPVNERTQLLS